MALWSNNQLILAFCFICGAALSQEESEITRYTDYKNKEQHEKYAKRREVVGAWQINQLKSGALVVRLKTNKMLIESLLKKGDTRMAEKKRLETKAVNLNTARAFRDKYKFSKLYFIYSSSSDSLLNGSRSNIFLDSLLTIDPRIAMTEPFYLLAESDFIYNSSIGFVPEDSARIQMERGNPTTPSPIVLKNKYGHQLKKPFPYYAYWPGFLKKKSHVYVFIEGKSIPFSVGGSNSPEAGHGNFKFEGMPLGLSIPKEATYEALAALVHNLTTNLEQYYRRHPNPEGNKYFDDAKPFLY